MSSGAFSARALLHALPLILLLAVLAFYGGVHWASEAPLGSAPVAEIEKVGQPLMLGVSIDTPMPAMETSARADADWPALPPSDVPLAQVFDELADRARRGDAGAACRLGSGLQRCAMAQLASSAADDMERDAARRVFTEQSSVDRIARAQMGAEQYGQGCEGLQPTQLDQAFIWQKQAAILDPSLRVWAALAPALDRQRFLDDLTLWNDYRSYAMPWLEAAAEQGDHVALIALARVHGDLRRSSPPFPPFRQADDERFLVYAQLMQRYGLEIPVVERSARALEDNLGPESRQRVAERVDALFKSEAPRSDAAGVSSALSRSLQPTLAEGRCGES